MRGVQREQPQQPQQFGTAPIPPSMLPAAAAAHGVIRTCGLKARLMRYRSTLVALALDPLVLDACMRLRSDTSRLNSTYSKRQQHQQLQRRH
jgi:hypothetical protein